MLLDMERRLLDRRERQPLERGTARREVGMERRRVEEERALRLRGDLLEEVIARARRDVAVRQRRGELGKRLRVGDGDAVLRLFGLLRLLPRLTRSVLLLPFRQLLLVLLVLRPVVQEVERADTDDQRHEQDYR